VARPSSRSGRRIAIISLTALTVVLSIARPVAAHGSTPVPDSAYYRAHLTAVTPHLPDISATVDPHTEWIEITYTGATEALIYGYTHEPYLRITAGGVEENQLSPATYINRSMFADLPNGTTTQPNTAPAWLLTSTTHTARWHDHRIHWMGQTRPHDVAADPSHAHLVGTWTIHAIADNSPFDIRGTLDWIGKPNTVLSTHVWLLLVAANLPLLAIVAVWQLSSRTRRRRSPALAGSPGLVGDDPVISGPRLNGPATGQ